MYDAIIGKYSYELLSALFLSNKVKPTFVQYVSQPNVFLSLVQCSLGVALLAESAKLNCSNNVIFKEIRFPDWVRAEVYLATKKHLKNTLVPEVYDCIMEALYSNSQI